MKSLLIAAPLAAIAAAYSYNDHHGHHNHGGHNHGASNNALGSFMNGGNFDSMRNLMNSSRSRHYKTPSMPNYD